MAYAVVLEVREQNEFLVHFKE